ncbi:MAG: 7-cyano-7-deazaguanine synthase QueC [Candidatus Zixiibacteriota bacterium]
MSNARNAVVLLSGGLDSAVALAICRSEGYITNALTIDYGQRHRVEITAAQRIAAALGVARHIILPVDLTLWGGSALTADLPVPSRRTRTEIGDDIPVTYVPARNTIFLALAMGWAETLETGDIFIGAHALDYSGYPDCRPEYFAAFEALANRATRSGAQRTLSWHVHTPLLHRTKSAIVRRGLDLGVPFGLTSSCYQPVDAGDSQSVLACGVCDACVLRRAAFAELGVVDPIPYDIPG